MFTLKRDNNRQLFLSCRYFPYIYNLSGFASAKAKMGSFFDYDLTPRSQIFKRDHSKITDMHSLFTIMRCVQFLFFSRFIMCASFV